MNNEIKLSVQVDMLYTEISGLIFDAKSDLKKKINLSIVELYWKIGKLLSEDVLNGIKAEYGKNIIGEISDKLNFPTCIIS